MYTITVEPTLETIMSDAGLDRLAEQGIASLSIPYEFYDLADSVIIARARAMSARGMRITTCHLPYGGNNDMFSPCSALPKLRKATILFWRHYLRKFALTGMHATPMHTGGCMQQFVPGVYRDYLADTLEQIIPDAAASGVIIALENTFFSNPPKFEETKSTPIGNAAYLNDDCCIVADFVVLQRHPNIRLCLDIGHTNLYGHDVMHDVARMAPHAALLHIHGNDGLSDRHYRTNIGNIPWQEVAAHLTAIGFNGEIFAEILDDPNPEIAAALNEPEQLGITMRAAQADIPA